MLRGKPEVRECKIWLKYFLEEDLPSKRATATCRDEGDVCPECLEDYVQAQIERQAMGRLKYLVSEEFMESNEVGE